MSVDDPFRTLYNAWRAWDKRPSDRDRVVAYQNALEVVSDLVDGSAIGVRDWLSEQRRKGRTYREACQRLKALASDVEPRRPVEPEPEVAKFAVLGAAELGDMAKHVDKDAEWVLVLGDAALSMIRPDLKVRWTRRHVLQKDGKLYFVTFTGIAEGNTKKQLERDIQLFKRMLQGESWVELASTSCVKCGLDEEDMVEHGMHLLFDDVGASYCNECWSNDDPEVPTSSETRDSGVSCEQSPLFGV